MSEQPTPIPHRPATTALLFALTALLWGGGAPASAMQAGVTPASWSVALRMAAAGALLLGYGAVRGAGLRLPAAARLPVVLHGVMFFAFAFISFYEATRRIPSGVAALILSLSSLFAALGGRLFLKHTLAPGLIWGALCGIAGMAVIFGPGIVHLGPESTAGIAWALASAVATAGGTIAGARNQRFGLSTEVALGWAALAGAAATTFYALASGAPFRFDLTFRYLGSLIYLAVVASCINFVLYFDLVRSIGPGRASYIMTLVPVVALALSAILEGFHLGLPVLAGAAAILLGNVLILKSPRGKESRGGSDPPSPPAR